jgi:leader peptidase (prepilin peptidase)/N-methyltransferase
MLISPWFDATLAGVVGLLIGSFLNVVIYRLPKIMERQWAAECAELSGTESPKAETFNLMVPRSRCQQCGHQIRWFENIPVLSYTFLRGKCSACHTPISLRYPLVELGNGALFFFCVWHWGATPTALVWCAFAAAVLALGLIDWDTTLLPDDITLPLLWAGLIAASLQWSGTTLSSALWGAVAAYMSLWLIYWAFKLLTGKEGMGYGDFKLLAAIGAWLGWKMLPLTILASSLVGAVIGIGLIVFAKHAREKPIPFGPYLAIAGLIAMFWGEGINRHYLDLF